MKNNYLVDTNIISELIRKHPDKRVVAWSETIERISLSVISLEEIHFGLAWKPNNNIHQWFEHFISDYCDISSITKEIAVRAGQIRGSLAARGISRTQADMLIAATAQLNQQTLVTRNVKNFTDGEIAVFNPFT